MTLRIGSGRVGHVAMIFANSVEDALQHEPMLLCGVFAIQVVQGRNYTHRQLPYIDEFDRAIAQDTKLMVACADFCHVTRLQF
jgi:hypothetical protein